MKIVVNGDSTEIQDGMTILQWIEGQKTIAAAAIIEYNGEILLKERWTETFLKEGDQLEVFQFLGGG